MTVSPRASLHVFLSMITFPGSVVHAYTRQLFCRMMRVPVFETVYFTVNEPCKYVNREESPPGKTFALICLGWLLDVLLGAVMLVPASLTLFRFGLFAQAEPWTAFVNLVTFWVGFSILVHSFPNHEELRELRARVLVNKEAPGMLRALTAPFFLVMGIVVWGSWMLFDALFGVAVVLLLPGIVNALFS